MIGVTTVVVIGGLELILMEVAVDVVAGGRLVQFPSFPGRQLSQNLFAFTQAQPLQEHICYTYSTQFAA